MHLLNTIMKKAKRKQPILKRQNEWIKLYNVRTQKLKNTLAGSNKTQIINLSSLTFLLTLYRTN